MSSLRTLPQQFGQGLTVDGTRIEQNVIALDGLRVAPPTMVERRWLPSWLCWGYQPDLLLAVARPRQAPWTREQNDGVDISPTYLPAPQPSNRYRHKGVYTPGIGHTGPLDALYSWEVAFETQRPTYLAGLWATMQTDAWYINGGTYGAPAPTTKTAGGPLDDLILQVFVDDHLDPEVRARTSVEGGQFNQPFSSCKMLASVLIGGLDTMQPPHPQEVAKGYLFRAEPDVLLPAGRIRIAVTIPQYSAFTTEWGNQAKSWQTAVWSIGAKLMEGTDV